MPEWSMVSGMVNMPEWSMVWPFRHILDYVFSHIPDVDTITHLCVHVLYYKLPTNESQSFALPSSLGSAGSIQTVTSAFKGPIPGSVDLLSGHGHRSDSLGHVLFEVGLHGWKRTTSVSCADETLIKETLWAVKLRNYCFCYLKDDRKRRKGDPEKLVVGVRDLTVNYFWLK